MQLRCLLQQPHDLCDVATVETYTFDRLWHYTLCVQEEIYAHLCERIVENIGV
jgi:hypothetical protein